MDLSNGNLNGNVGWIDKYEWDYHGTNGFEDEEKREYYVYTKHEERVKEE